MQKSAHPTAHVPARTPHSGLSPALDKGQKFEPFWNTAFGSDRRSQQRLLKADQKR